MSYSDWRREHDENQRRAAERLLAIHRRQAARQKSWIDRQVGLFLVGALLLGVAIPVGIALLLFWLDVEPAPGDDDTEVLILLAFVICLLVAGMARPR